MTITSHIFAGSACAPVAVSNEPDVPGWARRLVSRGVDRSERLGPVEITIRASDGAALVSVRWPEAASLGGQGVHEAARDGYGLILQRLGALGPLHAVRFWNFIPGIHAPMGAGIDRYMAFNRGRFEAFSAADPAFDPRQRRRSLQPIPAATAVGHDGRDLTVHGLALAVRGRSIENPRQVPAYFYSRRFGPNPPCFSRATEVTLPGAHGRALLIAGTASVVGEESCHPGDLARQFQETTRSLESLFGAWDGEPDAAWSERLVSLRAYLPPGTAGPENARDLLAGTFGQNAEIEVVAAHLCRSELLIEIEGVASQRRAGGRNGEGAP
jgi:chorismate lyase/3-hydroxybenzoate synthase